MKSTMTIPPIGGDAVVGASTATATLDRGSTRRVSRG